MDTFAIFLCTVFGNDWEGLACRLGLCTGLTQLLLIIGKFYPVVTPVLIACLTAPKDTWPIV